MGYLCVRFVFRYNGIIDMFALLFLWFFELAVILFKSREKKRACRKRLPNNNKNYIIVPSAHIYIHFFFLNEADEIEQKVHAYCFRFFFVFVK